MTDYKLIKCDECGKEVEWTNINQKSPDAPKLCNLCNSVLNMPEQYKEILTDKELLERINRELDKKIEGEQEARKTIFMVFNMRNVANLSKATDNLMVNDEGGTGKDYVVSAVYDLLPDAQRVKRVRISPKTLSYMNDNKNFPEGWTQKALYLEDVPNGVLNDDSFKVMCSADPDGITHQSIIVNNRLMNIAIKGKPAIVITIATASPKQEMLRRFPILNLTSTVEQTKAVLMKQAEFAVNGKSVDYDRNLLAALCAIRRVKVTVPFAKDIVNHFPSGNTIARTHFTRFIDYIKSSCSLYQYQREKDDRDYYIATEQDYEIARDMLTQTTSNQFMIPLTKKQKTILERFSEFGDMELKFSDIAVSMQDIYASRWLRTHLDRLTEIGLLTKGYQQEENGTKPHFTYRYSGISKIQLPHFKDLQNPTNTTYHTNNAHTANNANSSYSPSKENLHNLHNLHSAFNFQLSNIPIEVFKEKTGYTDDDIQILLLDGVIMQNKEGHISIL